MQYRAEEPTGTQGNQGKEQSQKGQEISHRAYWEIREQNNWTREQSVTVQFRSNST